MTLSEQVIGSLVKELFTKGVKGLGKAGKDGAVETHGEQEGLCLLGGRGGGAVSRGLKVMWREQILGSSLESGMDRHGTGCGMWPPAERQRRKAAPKPRATLAPTL